LPVLDDATDAGQADQGQPDARVYSAVWWPGWTPQQYRSHVEVVRSHIASGETYQTNLTVRMRGRVAGDPLKLYRDLALSQLGAYNAYLDLGRFVIASASPELFFQRNRDEVLLRPMKGTATRGRDAEQDHIQALALRADAKERAENVMIVDLMRNDIARIAGPGTVRVPALLTVERYPTVLQLTSDVTARLRPGTGLAELLFSALFPCGSVTGAPKPRTMALIRELEDTPRGIYCGAIGWVGPPTEPVRARFSVAIRTAVIDRREQTAVYGTGSGITWSSDPATEHREVLTKTAILRGRRPFHLFETMRHQPGQGLRNREHHLRRLTASATHLGFRLDLARVVTELDARLAPLADGPDIRVRLRLDRDGSIGIDLADAPTHATPCVVGLDDDPVDPESWWLFHKTSMREPYEERRARRPDVDDVILVNTRGELTETTRATLAVQLDGRWYTPPLDSGCLPGTERARRLAEATLHERVLTPADLTHADAIALLSSLRGARPAAMDLRPETSQARIQRNPRLRQSHSQRTAPSPDGDRLCARPGHGDQSVVRHEAPPKASSSPPAATAMPPTSSPTANPSNSSTAPPALPDSASTQASKPASKPQTTAATPYRASRPPATRKHPLRPDASNCAPARTSPSTPTR
jgi:para-aminobenzoate synthetase / 4-amino-4-deoxychorismate lyase